MSEYLLFLDESDKTSECPYFCLAGFIIERKTYEDKLIPKVNKCKDVLGNPHIVFHCTDMRKSIGQFAILKNGKLRDEFWNSLRGILKGTEFYTIGAYLDKVFLHTNFPKTQCKDSYLITMQKIVSNYVYFLYKHNSKGSILCESRNFKSDLIAQKSYFNIINNGTDILTSDMVKKYLTTISFNIKKDNCTGLQIADIIPITFLRHLQGKQDNYNLYQTLHSKLYDGNIEKPDIFGFTKIL